MQEHQNQRFVGSSLFWKLHILDLTFEMWPVKVGGVWGVPEAFVVDIVLFFLGWTTCVNSHVSLPTKKKNTPTSMMCLRGKHQPPVMEVSTLFFWGRVFFKIYSLFPGPKGTTV